jgi:hypothetical protein
VVALGMSHPKSFKPIQLQNNTRFIQKDCFSLNFILKDCPSCVEFETLKFDLQKNKNKNKSK